MITKRVKIPLYLNNLIIIHDITLEEVEKKYKLKSVKDFEACVFKYNLDYVMAFSGNKLNKRTIAHECVHFCNYVFTDRGIDLDPYNDEPYAYLLGWCFEQVDVFLTKIIEE